MLNEPIVTTHSVCTSTIPGIQPTPRTCTLNSCHACFPLSARILLRPSTSECAISSTASHRLPSRVKPSLPVVIVSSSLSSFEKPCDLVRLSSACGAPFSLSFNIAHLGCSALACFQSYPSTRIGWICAEVSVSESEILWCASFSVAGLRRSPGIVRASAIVVQEEISSPSFDLQLLQIVGLMWMIFCACSESKSVIWYLTLEFDTANPRWSTCLRYEPFD